MWSYFFFQAEDGIRDGHVTGVQTCALPISVIVQPIVNLDEFLLGAANLGLGAQVFSHEAEQQLHFRSLQSTDNSIQIDQQTNTIDLRVAESSPIPVILDDLSDVDVGGATHDHALLWNDV